MEIINKSNEDYKAARRIKNGKPYIYFSKDKERVFISAAAAWEWDLMPESRVHFAVDIDRVYLLLNNDPAGVLTKEHFGGLRFHAKLFTSMLYERNKLITPESKFPLRKSNSKINESITLEIMIHNKYKKK